MFYGGEWLEKIAGYVKDPAYLGAVT